MFLKYLTSFIFLITLITVFYVLPADAQNIPPSSSVSITSSNPGCIHIFKFRRTRFCSFIFSINYNRQSTTIIFSINYNRQSTTIIFSINYNRQSTTIIFSINYNRQSTTLFLFEFCHLFSSWCINIF